MHIEGVLLNHSLSVESVKARTAHKREANKEISSIDARRWSTQWRLATRAFSLMTSHYTAACELAI